MAAEKGKKAGTAKPAAAKKDRGALKSRLAQLKKAREQAKESKENGYLLRERRESSFTRSFRLPEGVDAGKIQAAFKNGVLELHVPKAPEAKPRRIQIAAN